MIRVISLKEREEVERHGKLIESFFPELRAISKCIQDQPHGVYDEETEALAALKVPRLAREIENSVDAIIVSCVADPGVAELRREVSVPVVGSGESLASIARALGGKVGVITITDGVPRPLRERLGDPPWKKVAGVCSTLDLKWKKEAVLQAAEHLLKEGCNVIALGCTGFSTIGIAPLIHRELGVVVLDPVVASGSVVYNLLVSKKVWG